MQSFLSNRFFIFLLGLLMGIALFLILLKYSDKISEFMDLKSDDKLEYVDDSQSNEMESTKKVKSKKVKNELNAPNDTTSFSLEIDSVNVDSTHLSPDENIIYSIGDGDFENIVVAKDILLMSKKYKPSGNPVIFYCEDPKNYDSLLVDNKIEIPKDGILVEFWKSPVNFKGYRLTQKKLIIYGIFEFENISFEYKDEFLMMNYQGRNYILRCNEEFIPESFGLNKRAK